MKSYKVLICGDRNWQKSEIIENLISNLYDKFFSENPFIKLAIIEGCARGADRAACLSEMREVEHLHFPADWNKYGLKAGPIRNQQMLDEGKPDVVYAFHDSLKESKGTKHMVKIAKKAGVPVYLGTSDGCFVTL